MEGIHGYKSDDGESEAKLYSRDHTPAPQAYSCAKGSTTQDEVLDSDDDFEDTIEDQFKENKRQSTGMSEADFKKARGGIIGGSGVGTGISNVKDIHDTGGRGKYSERECFDKNSKDCDGDKGNMTTKPHTSSLASSSSSSSSSSTSNSTSTISPNVAPSSVSNNFTLRGMSQREFVNSCHYIPMRMTVDERRLLNVLENALQVCEYTDVVDVTFSYTRKSKYSRILESLVDILSISCGLLMANNLSKGEAIVSEKTLRDNVPLFSQLFEIGRRYKIMNPGKMRDTYGKLMYILMDMESNMVKNEGLNLNFVKPILTITRFLEEKGALELLDDPLLMRCVGAVNNDSGEKTTREMQEELRAKTVATQALLSKYKGTSLSEADLQRVIDSIADNEAYLAFNVRPVERALKLLKESFDPQHIEEPFSLELTSRQRKIFSSSSSYFSSFSNSYTGFSSKYLGGGACLSHDHATQYKFVLQSLTLWREVMYCMPRLWMCADEDLTQQQYRLVDTGQGYQRLQSCPTVRDLMSRILRHVQKLVGEAWVGLSVVHLGDRDVPNALVFIDKYTQIPRILTPICQAVERLPLLVNDPAFHAYVSAEWTSLHGLRMQILSDFFKHGFDGSGDDGGSCIDGRLTSAWNWCSKLHKKPYYYVFMFTGFQGFDGDWKET